MSEFLRDLDRRVLPVLADAVPRMVDAARGRRALIAAGSTAAVILAVGLLYAVNRPGAAPSTGGPSVNIGVAEGDSVPRYITDKATELRRMDSGAGPPPSGAMYALVSLSDYETPDQLAATLSGLHVVTVFMRARPAGPDLPVIVAQAYRIPIDVESAMLARANHDRGEKNDLSAQVALVTGSTTEETELRAIYEARAEVATASEHAWRSLCACVFAAVVWGTTADLVSVSRRADVRIVDCVPALRSLDRAIFRPPLPEETGRAGAWPTDREFG